MGPDIKALESVVEVTGMEARKMLVLEAFRDCYVDPFWAASLLGNAHLLASYAKDGKMAVAALCAAILNKYRPDTSFNYALLPSGAVELFYDDRDEPKDDPDQRGISR